MKPFRKKTYPSISEVTKTEHIGMVKEIFGTITERYDFLNHLLSLRRDVAWRRFAVRRMHFFKTGRLLDVACGTADVAIAAVAHHIFLLAPTDRGKETADQEIAPADYEKNLHWFYKESLRAPIRLKATCAPHYFRIYHQRK